MADVKELDSRIARLEAALDATSKALRASREASARPDPAAGAELDAARARIAELEDALAAARAQSEAVPDGGGASGDDAESLRRELTDLREARAMDLEEMKALLAELEPMLERADA